MDDNKIDLIVSKMVELSLVLEKLTNEELADLLLDKVWSGYIMDSLESALVSEAIDRLRKK